MLFAISIYMLIHKYLIYIRSNNYTIIIIP